MAAEKARGTKTLSLSIRLDPKTRFVLEFMARMRGQSMTTVVERAVAEAADGVTVGGDWDPQSRETVGERKWSDFWDVSEGIRFIKLVADRKVPTTFDEDEILQFVRFHIEFFSEFNDLDDLDRANIELLWPNIEDYVNSWRERRHSDIWAAGQIMADDLSKAGLEPPDWPRGTKTPPPSKLSAINEEESHIDDEIPC